jgi:hypothetical protein
MESSTPSDASTGASPVVGSLGIIVGLVVSEEEAFILVISLKDDNVCRF